MASSLSKLALLTLAVPLSLVASVARAQDNPCGKFDTTGGLNCRIELKGGCDGKCTPLQFEAGCTGGCELSVDTTCTGDCETFCLMQCDPAHLDCFAGCHTECDEPCKTQCMTDHPGEDCVASCKGSCDMHCKSACGVTVDSCQQHCQECCHGACSTQVNLDCDLQCFAKLEGGCKVQCEAPTGAIFCNDQYVFASDVDACIRYLATQKINVDTSARVSGSVKVSSSSCTAAPGESSPFGTSGVAVAVAALGLAAARRRARARAR
jgi:hypothetical protein